MKTQFADLEVGHVFQFRGERYLKVGTAAAQDARRDATRFLAATEVEFEPGQVPLPIPRPLPN
jgi:hypothetical protein